MKKTKRKFVIWLHNGTCSDDDEWLAVMAKDRNEALEKAKGHYDSYRFSLGHCLPVREFYHYYGRLPLGKVVR
jgi:hypothetical protein